MRRRVRTSIPAAALSRVRPPRADSGPPRSRFPSGMANRAACRLDGRSGVLTATEPAYLERLRARFAGHPNVEVTRLYLPTVDGALAARRFDTVICLNVLEHVADDRGSLAAIARLLAPGGRLVLLVPAF